MEYEIKFHPMALQEFCSLDGSVKKLVKKQLDKLKTSPLLGEELGNKNGYDLTGYRKMTPAKSKSESCILLLKCPSGKHNRHRQTGRYGSLQNDF